MKRLVFDTNIRVSAVMFGGLPKRVTDFCRHPPFQSVVSRPLLDELERILKSRFHLPTEKIAQELEDIQATSLFVDPEERTSVCRDRKDDCVLECAVGGGAEVIVTGDLDLLVLGSFRKVRIISPRQLFDDLGIAEVRESKLR